MKKKFLLSAAVIALCAGAIVVQPGKAHAQEETGSLAYYPLSASELRQHYHEWKVFLEYNTYREPCQHYRDPPRGFVLKGCTVYRVEPPVASAASLVSAIEPAAGEPDTIYFDFDRSNIRESEKAKLNKIIDRIKNENPASVTIAGHADRAGPAEYNMGLSRRRAKAVADELVSHGISKEIVHQKAYGETDLAVPTADGVPLQANRRSVIIEIDER